MGPGLWGHQTLWCNVAKVLSAFWVSGWIPRGLRTKQIILSCRQKEILPKKDSQRRRMTKEIEQKQPEMNPYKSSTFPGEIGAILKSNVGPSAGCQFVCHPSPLPGILKNQIAFFCTKGCCGFFERRANLSEVLSTRVPNPERLRTRTTHPVLFGPPTARTLPTVRTLVNHHTNEQAWNKVPKQETAETEAASIAWCQTIHLTSYIGPLPPQWMETDLCRQQVVKRRSPRHLRSLPDCESCILSPVR